MHPTDAAAHLTTRQLEEGLAHLTQAPADEGRLEMMVRRPAVGEREVLEQAELDTADGLVGDTWRQRRSSRTADGSAHPDMQINIMSARDQLFLDMDLSAANLPPGTRLALGSAVLEVTPQPHTGCGKFVERFGLEAMTFVNSPAGRALNLRGINARVVTAGTIRVGDRARKIPAGTPGAPA